jgi:hypothetical protein
MDHSDSPPQSLRREIPVPNDQEVQNWLPKLNKKTLGTLI